MAFPSTVNRNPAGIGPLAIRGLEKPYPIEYRDLMVDHALSGKGTVMSRKIREGQGIVLIHPPAVKVCEAPGGPARLAGALRRHGVACRIWDANGEGQLALMESAARAAGGVMPDGDSRLPSDSWTRRAARHREANLARLRSWELYANPDRYRRAVGDVNRLLAMAAKPYGVRLSLADYEAGSLSPVRSADLLRAAATPEANPFYPWFRWRLTEIIAETPASHIGFSLNYLSQALTTFAMIGLIRREYPHLRIVLGGGLVTSWMRRPGWRDPFGGLIEELIAGPGEAALLLLFGKTHDAGSDLPGFDDFSMAGYLAPGAVLPYSASSGCWWRGCSFCPERAEGMPYRPLPAGRVTADLRVLTKRVQPVLIHLLDNALSPALLKALAAEPPGAPWYGFTRIIPQLANRDFCRQLKDSGCIMLKLGLESGDQGVLDALNKGVDLETAAAVLKNLKEAGIATYVYLLFGTPAETREAAERTMGFTVAHAGEIGFLNLAVFNLPAYGSDAEELDTGEFYEGDLSLYRRFAHPEGWNRGEVRRFLENDFKKAPAVAAVLRRDPPFFTSNHAPFLVMAPSRGAGEEGWSSR
jgi:hypothetical protein